MRAATRMRKRAGSIALWRPNVRLMDLGSVVRRWQRRRFRANCGVMNDVVLGPTPGN